LGSQSWPSLFGEGFFLCGGTAVIKISNKLVATMLAFNNPYSVTAFTVAIVLTVVGLVRFVIQIVRWDSEYENFMMFPLRLVIYAVPYLVVPGLGIVVGGVMVRSQERVRRGFAKASIYTSVIGLMLWISAFGMAIR
jgi:hypothetical protein